MVEISDKHRDVLEANICPYCGSKPVLVDDKEIYGRHYGMAYWCKPCDAYVGCHKDGITPKGRLANKELRKHKIEAHKYFDMIWKTKQMTRSEAYKWLSNTLQIPPHYTH